jgi:hypothetical protein
MKVNQIVGEHKKGVRAKIYARKPKAGPAPRQPIKPREIEQPKDINEGAMAGLHAELSAKYNELAPHIAKHKDNKGAEHLYHELASIAKQHGASEEFRRLCNGARHSAHMDYDTNPGGFENWFWYLGLGDQEHEQAVDEDPGAGQAIGKVASVAGDKVTIAKADGSTLDVAKQAVMPNPTDPNKATVDASVSGEPLKPGMEIDTPATETMLPNKVFAGTAVGQRPGREGQWRNKGPKANSPAKAGDLVGGMEESLKAEDRALLDKMLTIARLR